MKSDYQALIKKLRKLNPKTLDSTFLELHNQAFEHIDCLECANCCRSLGPRLTDTDIKRLASHFKLKSSDFIEQYLSIDEDKDYVFKAMPCPFLMNDNYCMVYKSRPKACREYPHTNQKNMKSILSVCVKNIATCPVVEEIFDELRGKVS
jgi:Fe-S-cluster containining protein